MITHKAPGPRRGARPSRSDGPRPGRDWQKAAHNVTQGLESNAMDLGADLFGVAPVERIGRILEQIQPHFEGRRILVAKDKSHAFDVFVRAIR